MFILIKIAKLKYVKTNSIVGLSDLCKKNKSFSHTNNPQQKAFVQKLSSLYIKFTSRYSYRHTCEASKMKLLGFQVYENLQYKIVTRYFGLK